jgi:putative hemolysin
MPGGAVMQSLAEMIALHVEVSGLENVPRSGPAMIVANHPTGIADGIVLYGALAQRRPDLFIFANADAIRVLPPLGELIAPVEWRPEKRSHKQNRETMDYARAAFAEGRLAVLFPSGRLAKRTWWWLNERPWMASGAMMARKFNLPVIPLHITARNSALFYLFDRIHPTLRDITLFHEVLNKNRQRYRLKIGTPIAPETLPAGSAEAIEVMRAKTLELGGVKPQSVLTAPVYGRPGRLKPARLGV